MRAINHALTGAIVGLSISEPAIALPTAFLSHYALDALPHYGPNRPDEEYIRDGVFRQQLILDAVLCLILVLILATFKPVNWAQAAICAFLAASPDLVSVNRYKKVVSRKKWSPNQYEKLATNIQWFEKPIGALVEVAWLIAGVTLLAAFLSVA